MCGFHVCLLSKDIGIMIASLHKRGSVWNDQLWSYCWIAHVCQHFVCDSIWSWRLLVFYTGWLLLGPRLVLDTLSCDPMLLSESFSFLVSVLLRFGVSYWLGCYLHQLVIRHVICLFACHHISILFQGCCSSLIVLVIQLFDKSPKLLIIPFKIQGGCFGFSLKWMQM